MRRFIEKTIGPLVAFSLLPVCLGAGTNEIERYNQAIRLKPMEPSLYDERGRAFGSAGELDRAINDFTHAIGLNPKDAVAYGLRGKAYADKGELEKAISDLNESIALNPNDALTYNNRGYLLTKQGELDKGLQDLEQAVRLDPKFGLAYANRGFTESKKGEFQRALKDFNEAIRLNPSDGKSYNSLAWLLATCPNASFRNGSRAMKAAKKACELTKWKIWYCVGTMAAACAETGDFSKAVDYEKQALSMDGLNNKDRVEAQEQLQLYQQKKPYHEPPRS